MAAEPAAQVIEALAALYGTNDRAAKEQANNWLEEFQKTPNAWTTADALLRSENVQLNVKLFAAQTFRQKIVYDLSQLDTAARISLRDSLLGLLNDYREGPRMIITQLCLSLAALALQLKEWKQVVLQFVELYGKNADTVPCLLEFLTVLPEEVNDENHRIPISDEDYKERAIELLTSNSEEILKLLLVLIQNTGTNTEMQKRIFQCLLSWLKSGDIDVGSLANNPLLNLSFDALNSEELFDIAVDVVCEIIHQTKEVQDYMPVVEQIYPRLQPLQENLKKCTEDEEDKIRGYCRIFTEAGESYLPLIIQHPDAFRGIVEGIAACTASRELNLAQITFYFWFQLANSLVEQGHEEAKSKFLTIYDSLVDVIIRHQTYPPDSQNLTAEERDDFRDFRHKVGDVLKDCCAVLGAKRGLSKPYGLLQKLLAGAAVGQTPTWQQIEAPIFALRSMGSEVPDDEESMMPQIMELLSKLPDHPKIRYAATLVISRYSSWTKLHPQFIEYQLNFISAGFENDEVAAASALALKHLCRDCAELLVGYLERLHPFFLNLARTLHHYDLYEVTEAIAHVIAVVPAAEMSKALELFLLPVAQRLHEIGNTGKPISETQAQQVADCLEQIGWFFRVVVPNVPARQSHPVVTFIQELWPVFDLVLAHYGSHPLVSEVLSKCFKIMIVSYRMHIISLLPQLMDRLTNVFSQTGLSCYIWVSSYIVREFANGESDEISAACLKFVETLSAAMFQMLGEKQQFNDVPDLIEEYFKLVRIFLEVAPSLIVQSPIFPSIFQAGLPGLSMDHQRALEAVLTFYRHLLSVAFLVSLPQPRSRPASPNSVAINQASISQHNINIATVQALFQQNGQSFVGYLINGATYHYPRDLLTDVSAIVKLLAELLPIESQQWMVAVVERFPVDHMSVDDKRKFLTDYTAAIREQQWKKVRNILNDFIAFYRRKNAPPRNRRVTVPILE